MHDNIVGHHGRRSSRRRTEFIVPTHLGELALATLAQTGCSLHQQRTGNSLNAPTTQSFKRLKHLTRYLKGALRYKLLLQPKIDMESKKDYDVTLVIPTDATWAGCPKLRKSTSGVFLEYLGTPIHLISRTQSVTAQSSAESELYAIGSGVTEGLHVRLFLLEAGLVRNATLEIQTDSSSAKSIAKQYGTSRKTRHIQLRYLLMQDLVRTGILKITKINGEQNPADAFTKFVKFEVLRRRLQRIGLVIARDDHDMDARNARISPLPRFELIPDGVSRNHHIKDEQEHVVLRQTVQTAGRCADTDHVQRTPDGSDSDRHQQLKFPFRSVWSAQQTPLSAELNANQRSSRGNSGHHETNRPGSQWNQ